MKELESITAETLVDSKELNQLIARLSNPTHGRSNGGVSVKDIAETMDLNEDKVIQELVRMRKQKETQPVPQQAEKLVAALDELKSTDFRPVSNRPLKRVPATLVILICALLFGIFIVVTRFLAQPSGPLPEKMPVPDTMKRS